MEGMAFSSSSRRNAPSEGAIDGAVGAFAANVGAVVATVGVMAAVGVMLITVGVLVATVGVIAVTVGVFVEAVGDLVSTVGVIVVTVGAIVLESIPEIKSQIIRATTIREDHFFSDECWGVESASSKFELRTYGGRAGKI
jgi:hypothetical protein